jgi:hypothetical protein
MASGPKLWIPRILIGVVTFFNLQCALAFILSPARYAPSFEVSGVPGTSLVSALGILFLMWNIPYLFALYHPHRHRTSLTQAVLMQATGLVGETILLIDTPATHMLLRQTALRFILFDASGLLLLSAAWLLICKSRSADL